MKSHFDWQMSIALLFDNWIRNFHSAHPCVHRRQYTTNDKASHQHRDGDRYREMPSKNRRYSDEGWVLDMLKINRHRFRKIFVEMRFSFFDHIQFNRFVCSSQNIPQKLRQWRWHYPRSLSFTNCVVHGQANAVCACVMRTGYGNWK